MLKIPARGRIITQEPHTIAPHLLEAPLATFRRRLIAYLLDCLVFGVIIGALFIVLTAWSIHRQEPDFFPRWKAMNKIDDATKRARENDQLTFDFLKIVDQRCPDALPSRVKDKLGDQGSNASLNVLDFEDLQIGFGSGPTRLLDEGDDATLSMGTDMLLGSSSSFLSWGAFFIGWFTLWTRLGKGRTLGKLLMGIRVIKLDGRGLSWWDTFSRAGGYGASAATLLLGFLEAIWHPNRQAMHDRIAGTVVTRVKR